MGPYDGLLEGAAERTRQDDARFQDVACNGLEMQRGLRDTARLRGTFVVHRSRRAPDLQMGVTLRADGVPTRSDLGRYAARRAEFGSTRETPVLLLAGRQPRTPAGAGCVPETADPGRRSEATPAAQEVVRRRASLAPTGS